MSRPGSRMLGAAAAAVSSILCATRCAPVAVTPASSAAQGRSIAGAPPTYPGYALVWADEFDRNGDPDPNNWGYERGFVRNRELQWYQPENARIAEGLLVIEARRERVANPNFEAGS